MGIRLLVLALLVVFAAHDMHGQDIDSLIREFKEAETPSEKATTGLLLGNHYFYANEDSAKYFYDEVFQTIPAINDDSLYIEIHEILSRFEEVQGHNKEALFLVRKAWQRVISSGRTEKTDQMYILLGRYHMRLTNFDSAAYYWNKLLQSKDQKGDEYGKWLPHHYLASMYTDLGDWDEAKIQYEKALEYVRMEKRPKDYLFLLYLYIQGCDEYGDLDMYSKLRNEYLAFKQEQGQNILSADHSTMMKLEETPAERRKRLLEYLPFHIRNKSYYSSCDTYFRIGQSYLEEKNYTEALRAFQKMLLYTDTIELPLMKFNAHLNLYKAYRAMNDYPNALLQYELIYNFRDTIMGLEKQKQLNEMVVKYETAEKEKQLAETSLHLETAQKKQQFLSFGLLGALLVSGLSYYAFRTKTQTNKMLEEKNKVISKALQEKDILLREIHHRVKNNLQMISALLYLHGKSVDDSTAQEALMESQNRVQSMAMIHQNLYQDENLLGVSINAYLDKLLQHLISSYNIEQNRITIDKHIDVPQLDIDTVIPLALIINELISNALKYAFRDGRKGEIRIDLQQTAGSIVLEVRDNGMGFPDHFSLESSANFGLKLINILCDRLGASWSLHTEHGTRINLSIPLKKAA